jgi:hypothetical protein
MSSAAQIPFRRTPFPVLLYGAAIAPIFWLGQLMLGYAVTAFVCFPGDHPEPLNWPYLGSVLAGFNVVAILVAASGGLVALRSFRGIRRDDGQAMSDLSVAQGRARFLALWGIFSSLCFFLAILFNTIAAITVPPCLN